MTAGGYMIKMKIQLISSFSLKYQSTAKKENYIEKVSKLLMKLFKLQWNYVSQSNKNKFYKIIFWGSLKQTSILSEETFGSYKNRTTSDKGKERFMDENEIQFGYYVAKQNQTVTLYLRQKLV